MSDFTCSTENAIRNAQAFKSAWEKAERAAIKGIVTDVLGDEWSKKQFDAINWCKVLHKNGMNNRGITVPSLETLRNYGWVEYRREEFELPETAKRKIAMRTVTITFDNGETVTWRNRIWDGYHIGELVRRRGHDYTIVEIEPAESVADLKGRRYLYHFI